MRPSETYTLRTTTAVDAPYVQEFYLRRFVDTNQSGQAHTFGNRVLVPDLDNQTIFVNMAAAADGAAAWRGTIPAGTRLSNHEGSDDTLTRCELAQDFTVTDSSILPGLQFGGNPVVEGAYQPMVTRRWGFAIPREPVYWNILTVMEVIPLGVSASPGQITWCRFTDIGTSLAGGFSTDAGIGRTVLTSQRVRTFAVDSLVAQKWHEGDFILSDGQHYVIQSRRVLPESREIEFDSEATPKFRLVAPPEDTV